MSYNKRPLLDAEQIKAKLGTKRIGREVLVLDTCASTNDVAAGYAESGDNDGLAVLSEEQTAGRGRAGTKWQTVMADSILCSVLLTRCGCGMELLSLSCAVAVAETIGKCGRSSARIKWPNDVVLGDKKVSGILLETKIVGPHRAAAYIAGVGINCHQSIEDFPPQLRQTATSIDIETGATCNRNLVARSLLSFFDHWLAVAERSSKKVIERWKQMSVLLGRRTRLLHRGRIFTGNCIGIDPQKGLTVQLETGGVRMFDAAHTRIAELESGP
jgi:BirA family biotin operon repressor/biotin-[acetyl-CoA-carboxylase] ligase